MRYIIVCVYFQIIRYLKTLKYLTKRLYIYNIFFTLCTRYNTSKGYCFEVANFLFVKLILLKCNYVLFIELKIKSKILHNQLIGPTTAN